MNTRNWSIIRSMSVSTAAEWRIVQIASVVLNPSKDSSRKNKYLLYWNTALYIVSVVSNNVNTKTLGVPGVLTIYGQRNKL